MEINDHVINENTVLFTGEYDKWGNLCTRVIEGVNSFVVNESPVDQIDKTLLNYGSSFSGALQGSKHILGPMKMYPIKINENKDIWLFPTKSFKKKNCVWFNLYHVIRTKAQGVQKTEVLTTFGHSFIINMKESAFNNKRQKAQQLREIILKDNMPPLERCFKIIEESDTIQITNQTKENLH
ncbi:competence protein ComK [Neobacillus sp. PS3-40]|jgi:competence protein ComK|uniref:competence protein ComK n=1 Tax=Neobacillus sp. PS3-40 TaxID=3070679 RepID=UPI0027DF2F26|nr:competence protein ComK [Neobacillus sp. PS3-40]WML43895.1 competence protein ComK [Neobacillus sp. PS3-40]